MIVDQTRGHLYSSCENVISVIDLQATGQNNAFVKVMDTPNMKPSALEYDKETQRLFVGSQDGMFIIFDTS